MKEELAILTIGYLVGYYKTHDETIINKDEIDAINFIIGKNETLQQELQKYKSLYENEKDKNDTLNRVIKKIEKYIKSQSQDAGVRGKTILDLLKEIK